MKPSAGVGLSRRCFLKSSALFLGAWRAGQAGAQPIRAATPAGTKPARLKQNPETGGYNFETEQMRGTIQPQGAYHGVTQLLDQRTGRVVTDARYSALNLFRLFSVNLGMGQPRTMERKIQATGTAVEIFWPATEAHLGEIRARYEVREPNVIDLTVTLRSRGNYPGYEVLLPNYFDKVMIPHVFLKQRIKGTEYGGADLVVPTVNDAFRGGTLVFPRDTHAARRALDGRWNRSEFKSPTAPFYPVRHYAHPLAFVADPEKKMAAVLMMRREQCSSLSSRYYAERAGDRATSYTAIDFFLFGDDLVPGDERTAKIRLALTPLDAQMSQPLELYRAFLAETEPVR